MKRSEGLIKMERTVSSRPLSSQKETSKIIVNIPYKPIQIKRNVVTGSPRLLKSLFYGYSQCPFCFVQGSGSAKPLRPCVITVVVPGPALISENIT